MSRQRVMLFSAAVLAGALVAVALRGQPWHSPVCAEEQPAPKGDEPKVVPAAEAENPWKNEPAREPAVAGKFYLEDKTKLAAMIQGFLDKAGGERIERVRGLVCPHAGYEYSGQTAAYSFKQVLGRDYRTVIVMGPSHHTLFAGAYIAPLSGYKTPLGLVPYSPLAAKLASAAPFVTKPEFESAPAPWPGAEKITRPDQFEHSVEVEVPFLQQVLKDFKLVPIVFGEVEPADVAAALRDKVDEQTLVVASSDLSHFYTDEQARALDTACTKAICDLDVETLKRRETEACGKAPVLALVELARIKGWKTKLLDYRNSSAATGDKSRVVGYSAIAFFDAGGEGAMEKAGAAAGGKAEQAQYNADERKWMLELARLTLTEVANGRAAPEPAEKDVPAKLRPKGACFVTLTINGDLRGCIGHILAHEPLYKSVRDNAHHAAMEDPRFNQVRPEEVGKIHIEISVLTNPEPLAFTGPDDLLKKLQPNKDGVILKVGGSQSTFLPQVWEKLPDKVEFLNHLSQKAGMPASAWRDQDTQVSIYHVEAFEEGKF